MPGMRVGRLDELLEAQKTEFLACRTVCSFLFSSSSPRGRNDLSRLFKETTNGLDDPKVQDGSYQSNRVKIP